MSDERADLIRTTLRAIRVKLDEHDRKFDEVITRFGRGTRLPARAASRQPARPLCRPVVRLDKLDRRLDRVERRLDLVDKGAG
jgi:hypothetical protein